MASFPATKHRTVVEERTTHSPLYKVLLHNDDVNDMEHVMRALMRVFRFEKQVCERIMIEAHNTGVALCTVESFERAELHREQLQAHSLVATIEPE